MEKIKRFVDIYIPVETCNLRCEYCYVTKNRKFNSKIMPLAHSISEIKQAFSKEKLGGTCLINMCAGGETLLPDYMTDVIKVILENGHYLMIVTNGTVKKRFEELIKLDEKLKKRLFFKFSFQYLELKRLNMMKIFFDNVKLAHSAGCSITVEVAASDSAIPYIDDIKEVCMENVKALPHVTLLRDVATDNFSLLSNYKMDKLKEIWGSFHSELFDFRSKIWEIKRKEFCYAGVWSICVDLQSGNIKKCFDEKSIGNIYNDKQIKFEPVGKHCKAPYCFAGHAFIALGTVPEIDIGSFDSLRDRPQAKWLYPEIKNIMKQKLKNNNEEYSNFQKFGMELKLKNRIAKVKLSPKKISYNTVKNIKSSAAPYASIIDVRQDLNTKYKKIPKQLEWIVNYQKERDKVLDGDQIVIIANGDKHKKAQGNEIWIVGALVDNNWYNASEIFDNGWLDQGLCKVWRSYDLPKEISNTITGKIPKGKDIYLIFERNKWRGNTTIKFKGKSKTVNLYTNKDDELLFAKIR